MAEFIESIEKGSMVKHEKPQTIKKHNKEPYSPQSKLWENALTQNNVIEQAINIIGDTIEDMDVEIKRKEYRLEFLEKEIEIPDS